MENNNIMAAPQVADVDYFFARWQRNHAGSKRAFIDFMTTPGAEREEFVASLPSEEVKVSFTGAVAAVTLIV